MTGRPARASAARVRRPASFLGGLGAAEFLSRHWQKEPLLVRGALPGYGAPVSPDDLAALALSHDVESRLVEERDGSFQLTRGPFEEADFARLPEKQWTLLVQDLDQHVPEIAELFTLLDFLPSYRLDDVMASTAAPGGSVGPHFDQYDVFLLQVTGQRRWQIAKSFDATKLRDDTELCVLSEFHAEAEWVLGPGDMLYLPPRVAHYGVAVDSCMTFSLGCRAPSVAEIVAHFARMTIDALAEDARYEDPDLTVASDRHVLDPAALARTSELLRAHFAFDDVALARGLSSLLTQPKALFAHDEAVALSARAVERGLGSKGGVVRRTGSRWLLCPLGAELVLFVDGHEFAAPGGAVGIARELCEGRSFSADRVRAWRATEGAEALLVALMRRGALVGARR